MERVITIMQNLHRYKIQDWLLNDWKDVKDGKYSHILANGLSNNICEDLKPLKNIWADRRLSHP